MDNGVPVPTVYGHSRSRDPALRSVGAAGMCVLLLVLLLSPGMSRVVNAQGDQAGVVVLTGDQGRYPLGLHLEILQDPSAKLTIDQVAAPEFDLNFEPSQEVVPNLGYTASAYWVRFHLRNETRDVDEWRLDLGLANMQHVSLYLPRTDSTAGRDGSEQAGPLSQRFQIRETGTLLPFASRDLVYHTFVFKIPLPPGAEQTVYMRFESEAAMTLPLTLLSGEAFAEHSRGEIAFSALLCGALLIMLGYNLIVGMALRDRSFVYYALFVGAAIMYQASIEGFGSQYLWPGQPWLNRYAVPFWMVWAIAFSLLFGASFLETAARAPRLHRVILLLLALCGMVLVQIPLVPYRLVVQQGNVLIIAGAVLLTVAACVVWRRGHRAARLYLLSWIGALILASAAVLVRMGVLPSTPLIEYGYQVGVVVAALLMSLALGDQVNTIRQGAMVAQARVMAAMRENETLIREQHAVLEARVAERTEALRAQKEEMERFLSAGLDLVCIADTDGYFRRLNPAWEEVLGWPRRELEGRPFLDLVHPDDVEATLGVITRLTTQQTILSFSNRYRTADGTYRWLEWRSIPHGKLVYATARDVTEQREMVEMLRRGESRRHRAYQLAQLGHWDWVVETNELRWSREVFAIFGQDPEHFAVTIESFEAAIHPEDLEAFRHERARALAEHRDINIEHRIIRADGSVRHVQELAEIVCDEQGGVISFLGTVQDITERRQAEEAMARYQDIVSCTPEGIAFLDEQYRYVVVNSAFERFSGLDRSQLIGRTVAEHLGDEAFQEQVKRYFDKCLQGETINYQAWFEFPVMGKRWMDVTYFPYVDNRNRIAGIVANSRDMTERRELEEALRESEAMLKMAQHIAQLGSCEWNVAHNEMSCSDELYRIFGVGPDFELAFETIEAMIHPDDRSKTRDFVESLRLGTDSAELEFRIIRPDGSVRDIHQIAQVQRDSAGKVQRVYGTMQDVTVQRAAQERLRASLREKEVLLQEIHHRVKNNLQVISSLLDMQSMAVENPEAIAALDDSRHRVRTMAFVHERLYQSADLASIDVREYLAGLTSYLFTVYEGSREGVSLTVRVDDVGLDLDTAIATGLIVNELVSNALKHAFPSIRQGDGQVGVALNVMADGRVHLQVTDNGVGLPADLEIDRTESLGLRLVSMLTQQLHGTLELSRNGGTSFRITFAAASGVTHTGAGRR